MSDAPDLTAGQTDEAIEFVQNYITPLAKAFHASVGNFHILLGKPGFQSWVATPQEVQDAWMAIAWCLIKTPGADIDTLHNAWWDFKKAQGWKLGAKDWDAKTHPMMKPLSDCPSDFAYRYVICTNVYTTLTSGWTDFSTQ